MKNFHMVSLNIHIWLIEYTYMCTVEASGSVGLPMKLHYVAVTGERSEAQRAGEPVSGLDCDSNTQWIQFSTILF